MKAKNNKNSEILASVNKVIRALDRHIYVSKGQVRNIISETRIYLRNLCEVTLAEKVKAMLYVMNAEGYTCKRMKSVMERVKSILLHASKGKVKTPKYDRSKMNMNLRIYYYEYANGKFSDLTLFEPGGFRLKMTLTVAEAKSRETWT